MNMMKENVLKQAHGRSPASTQMESSTINQGTCQSQSRRENDICQGLWYW